jgi:hypothetical protein
MVVKEGANSYTMWYTARGTSGTTTFIGRVTSSDGINWGSGTTVFGPGLSGATGYWDSANVGSCWVIKGASGASPYQMWYSGNDVPGDDEVNVQIGYATSTDGINWTKGGHSGVTVPVLECCSGVSPWAWDAEGVAAPTVVYMDSSEGTSGASPYYMNSGTSPYYRMWYVGWNESQGTIGIGYAESLSGTSPWHKYDDPATGSASGQTPYAYSDPVIALGNQGSWDGEEMFSPSVCKDNGIYRMWYDGETGGEGSEIARIGYAYSLDGIHWRKYDGNPVVMEGSTGSFDEDGVLDPMVLKDGNTYKMWYAGDSNCAAGPCDTEIGYATSQAYQGSQPAINNMAVASVNSTSGMNIMFYFVPEGPGPLDINEIKVEGPNNFSYTFSDWEVMNINGYQFPLKLLEAPGGVDTGQYTFTVKTNNGQTASNSVTLGGAALAAINETSLDRAVNDGTWNTSEQVYINPTATPQFRWKPYLGDDKYYRVIVFDWRYRAVWYSPTPQLGSTKSGDGYMYAQLPFELLKYNTPYHWAVEVLDTNNLWSAHNRTRSDWRDLYTGTRDEEEPYDFLMFAGLVSSRSFRDGNQSLQWAGVWNLAPWDIDITTNIFRVKNEDASEFYAFSLDKDAFTNDPFPFMYNAWKNGIPPDTVGSGYEFYVSDGTNSESMFRTFADNDHQKRTIKDEMSPADNAYLSDNEPIFTWKSKGPAYWHRLIISDWNYRRVAYRTDYLKGTAEGNVMSIQVPRGTLKGYSPYRWFVDVQDDNGSGTAPGNNRTRSHRLSFMTGRDLSAGTSALPAIYILLLGD